MGGPSIDATPWPGLEVNAIQSLCKRDEQGDQANLANGAARRGPTVVARHELHAWPRKGRSRPDSQHERSSVPQTHISLLLSRSQEADCSSRFGSPVESADSGRREGESKLWDGRIHLHVSGAAHTPRSAGRHGSMGKPKFICRISPWLSAELNWASSFGDKQTRGHPCSRHGRMCREAFERGKALCGDLGCLMPGTEAFESAQQRKPETAGLYVEDPSGPLCTQTDLTSRWGAPMLNDHLTGVYSAYPHQTPKAHQPQTPNEANNCHPHGRFLSGCHPPPVKNSHPLDTPG